jgi:hypothetical protein
MQSNIHAVPVTISNEGTRNEVRKRVIDMFFQESPGTGKGDEASKYIYYVEKLNGGNRVYLQRPANLHNGFDFLVCVEDMNYANPGERKRNYPKHTDIGKDLEIKKEKDPDMYRKLYALLLKVFECHDVLESEMQEIHFQNGLSVEHILKTIKWLFIEQDIRYWNYSGRNMTWDIVPQIDSRGK